MAGLMRKVGLVALARDQATAACLPLQAMLTTDVFSVMYLSQDDRQGGARDRGSAHGHSSRRLTRTRLQACAQQRPPCQATSAFPLPGLRHDQDHLHTAGTKQAGCEPGERS